jgi:ABC-type sugar transport system substrate-binding protein
MSRLMKFFILLLIVTLALAACGGGDEAAPEAPAAEEPAAEEPAAEEPAEEEPAAEEPAEEEPAEEEALEETEVGGAMVRTPDEVRIIVVSHGQASDPFWSVVKNGVDQAAEDFGVDVEYQAPQTFDLPTPPVSWSRFPMPMHWKIRFLALLTLEFPSSR